MEIISPILHKVESVPEEDRIQEAPKPTEQKPDDDELQLFEVNLLEEITE